MALLFCDSFDHLSVDLLTTKWSSLNLTGGIYTDTGRFGSCLKIENTFTRMLTKSLGANYTTLICGFAFKFTVPGSGVFWSLLDNGSTQVDLRLTASGQLELTRNGTVLATSTRVLEAQAWYHIQVKVTIDNTAGSVEVKVNNEVWATASGVDTQNTSNAYANQVRLQNSDNHDPDYFDDFWICDTSGSQCNDYLGDVRVEALRPSGAGATTQMTPSVGANYECVDDTTPDADTTYVSSATAGNKDTYACGDLTSTTGTVKALVVHAYARKDDAGERTLKAVVRHGGTDYEHSDARQVLDSYRCLSWIFETNPGTGSAWTISDVNGAEFGQKLVS